MIKNKTTGKIIVRQAKHCKTIFSKAKGLMFSPKIKDKGLIFHFDKEQTVSLHMLFVFQTIDVLFLDKNKKVVEIKRKFKPFTFYMPKNKSVYVIELPEDYSSKIKKGNIIEFN
jgi:uncharacterized membrane protein (UPF0127 family)